MPRVIAFCLGAFGLINAAGGMVWSRWDANIWWIDLHEFPGGFVRPAVALVCALLIGFAFAPAMGTPRRFATLAALGGLLIVCVCNAVDFWMLLHRGEIRAGVPVPLSAVVAAALCWIGVCVTRRGCAKPLRWRVALPAALLCLLGFPLAQMFFFGKTDYRRSADAAVVFGARVYADGSASTALSVRVWTACELYRLGLVKTLILSGGPGDGAVHETEAMRALALKWGVPDERLVLDRSGVNTRATLAFTREFVARGEARRVLAVSHFYHLPRIKLESQRLDCEVWTVPAYEVYTLRKLPLLMAREVAALWKYYVWA
jgi:vancomycin permeability regulator SanA